MIKKILCLVLVAVFVTVLAGCGFGFLKGNGKAEVIHNTETLPPQVAIQPTDAVQTQASPTNPETSQAESSTEAETTTEKQETTEKSADEESQSGPTEIQKTGDMAFSDDPNNKFINAISQKYNVNAQNLVALYTVPENDANTVLEFDGSKGSDGKLIRNEDTLVAIYTIDAALNSQRASKDSSKNEYSYGEMMVMFMSVTKYIMPEFESELKG